MTAAEVGRSVPEVSIIVPSYKGVDRLPALFDAFAHQGEGTPSFEVILVVDGVDDGSPNLAAAEKRFVLRTIVLPENRGRVAALNEGFRAAEGHVLVRCDDDFAPGPSYVKNHAAAHAGSPVGVVGTVHNIYEPSAYSITYGEDADRRMREHSLAAQPQHTWKLWNGNTSVSREVFEAVGEFDPAYRLYGWEDVDYGYRVHAAGFPVIVEPTLEVDHRAASVTTVIRAQRAFHSAAARRIFERLHPEAPLGPAVPKASPWNLTVRALSRVFALAGVKGWASTVDVVVPHLPRPVGRKLIALTVEAAGVAGYRAPNQAKDVF